MLANPIRVVDADTSAQIPAPGPAAAGAPSAALPPLRKNLTEIKSFGFCHHFPIAVSLMNTI